MTGDFNASIKEWGSESVDKRRRGLKEWVEKKIFVTVTRQLSSRLLSPRQLNLQAVELPTIELPTVEPCMNKKL